jgi:hypothetical protein
VLFMKSELPYPLLVKGGTLIVFHLNPAMKEGRIPIYITFYVFVLLLFSSFPLRFNLVRESVWHQVISVPLDRSCRGSNLNLPYRIQRQSPLNQLTIDMSLSFFLLFLRPFFSLLTFFLQSISGPVP